MGFLMPTRTLVWTFLRRALALREPMREARGFAAGGRDGSPATRLVKGKAPPRSRMDGRSLQVGNLFSVDGKRVAITGGARGIGLMLTVAFVENGATVYISSRDAKACEAVAASLTARGPGSCVAIPEDLATDAGCRRFAARLGEALGSAGLDVLINNSGVAWGEDFETFSEKGWKHVMAVNVEAVFNCTRACLPLLEQSQRSPARVINVGSIAGLRPQAVPTWSYDVSKAAVHHLTVKMAGLLVRRPGGKLITVNALAPGYVPSKMSKQLDRYEEMKGMDEQIPLKRMGNASDMAGAAIYLASEAGAWVTGIVLPVDGGFMCKL